MSTLSAILMATFFVLLGVTVGVFVGSFFLGKRKFVSVGVPSIVASIMTLLMYVGEMFLLNGHLYSFGTGGIFEGISGIVLAPVDIIIVIAAGLINFMICYLLNCKKDEER